MPTYYNKKFLFRAIDDHKWRDFAQKSVSIPQQDQRRFGEKPSNHDTQVLFFGPLTKEQKNKMPLKKGIFFKSNLTSQALVKKQQPSSLGIPHIQLAYCFHRRITDRLAFLGGGNLEIRLRAVLYATDLNYRFALQGTTLHRSTYTVPIELSDQHFYTDKQKEQDIDFALSSLSLVNGKHTNLASVSAQSQALSLMLVALNPTMRTHNHDDSYRMSMQCEKAIFHEFDGVTMVTQSAFFHHHPWMLFLFTQSTATGQWVNRLCDSHRYDMSKAIALLSRVFSSLPMEKKLSNRGKRLCRRHKTREMLLQAILKTGVSSQYTQATYCAYVDSLLPKQYNQNAPSYLMGSIDSDQWCEFVQRSIEIRAEGKGQILQTKEIDNKPLLCGTLAAMQSHVGKQSLVGFKLGLKYATAPLSLPYRTIFSHVKQDNPHFSITVFGQADITSRLTAQLYACDLTQRWAQEHNVSVPLSVGGGITSHHILFSTVPIEIGRHPYTDEHKNKDFHDVLAALETEEHENKRSYFSSKKPYRAYDSVNTRAQALALTLLALQNPTLEKNPLCLDKFHPPRKYDDVYRISTQCDQEIEACFLQLSAVSQHLFFRNPVWVKLLLIQSPTPVKWVCRLFECYRRDMSGARNHLTDVFSYILLEKASAKHDSVPLQIQRRTFLLNTLVTGLNEADYDSVSTDDVLKKNRYMTLVQSAYLASILPDMVRPKFNINAYLAVLPPYRNLHNTLQHLSPVLLQAAGERLTQRFIVNSEFYSQSRLKQPFIRFLYTFLFFNCSQALYEKTLPNMGTLREYNGFNQLLIYIGDNIRKDPLVRKMAHDYLLRTPDFLYQALRVFNSPSMQGYHTGHKTTGPAPLLNYIKLCRAADQGEGQVLLSQLTVTLTRLAQTMSEKTAFVLLPALWRSVLIGMKAVCQLAKRSRARGAAFFQHLFSEQLNSPVFYVFCTDNIAQKMREKLLSLYCAGYKRSPCSFWFSAVATLLLTGGLTLSMGLIVFLGLHFHMGALSTALLFAERMMTAIIGPKIGIYVLVACMILVVGLFSVAAVQCIAFQVACLLQNKRSEETLRKAYFSDTPFIFTTRSQDFSDHRLSDSTRLKTRSSFSVYSMSSTLHADTALYAKMQQASELDTPSSVNNMIDSSQTIQHDSEDITLTPHY